MKRLYFATCIIVVSCVIASCVIIPLTSPYSPDSAKTGAGYSTQGEYVIKSRGDRIVVYKGKDNELFLETTSSVSSLPPDIQAKLNIGLHYPDEKSMKTALDEFCS